MDWTWIIGTAGTITAAAITAYLKRGRLAQTGSAVGSFFAAHKNLQTCRSEIANLAASFARQRVEMAAELERRDKAEATERERRDRTEAYLTSRLEFLLTQGEKVSQARRQGLVTGSETSGNAPPPSPANSPPSPQKPGSTGTRDRLRRPPVVRNGPRVRR